jgi:hypothetical protein
VSNVVRLFCKARIGRIAIGDERAFELAFQHMFNMLSPSAFVKRENDFMIFTVNGPEVSRFHFSLMFATRFYGDYSYHPDTRPYGPTFGCTNSFHTNLSSIANTLLNKTCANCASTIGRSNSIARFTQLVKLARLTVMP